MPWTAAVLSRVFWYTTWLKQNNLRRYRRGGAKACKSKRCTRPPAETQKSLSSCSSNWSPTMILLGARYQLVGYKHGLDVNARFAPLKMHDRCKPFKSQTLHKWSHFRASDRVDKLDSSGIRLTYKLDYLFFILEAHVRLRDNFRPPINYIIFKF